MPSACYDATNFNVTIKLQIDRIEGAVKTAAATLIAMANTIRQSKMARTHTRTIFEAIKRQRTHTRVVKVEKTM